jgi:hypothetical protein
LIWEEPNMFPRDDHWTFSLVSLLAAVLTTAGTIWGQAAPITCQAIAAGTVVDAKGIDLMADIPSKATPISEQVFVRTPTLPGHAPTPWVQCSYGKECDKAIFGVPYTRLDAQDQATTWVEHVQAECNASGAYVFCATDLVRLVLTYSYVSLSHQCASQATFGINPGKDIELTLSAPAPANGMRWAGWMRETPNGSQWNICDGTDLNHTCGPQKHFFFSQAMKLPVDDADKAAGMFFSCTNKFTVITGYAGGQPINTTYNGPARWCRAAVYYMPSP